MKGAKHIHQHAAFMLCGKHIGYKFRDVLNHLIELFSDLPLRFEYFFEHISSIIQCRFTESAPTEDLRLVERVSVVEQNVEH